MRESVSVDRGSFLPLAIGVVAVVASVASVALLAYDVVLVRRLLGGGVGRVADPNIWIAYVCAGCGVAGSGIVQVASRSAGTRLASAVVLAVAIAAMSLWLVLHLGGFVYSHSSVMPQ